MEKLYTHKELSEALDINLAKQKRHAREFIGIDPEAGQSSGVERKLSLEQAFVVYLSGLAVNKYKVPLVEAKKLSKSLFKWLDYEKYFPLTSWLKGYRKVVLGEEVSDTKHTSISRTSPNVDWYICVTKTESGYRYSAKGSLSFERNQITKATDLISESYYFESLAFTSDPPQDWEAEAIHTSFIKIRPNLLYFLEKVGAYSK